jgi:hypothetical protein
MACTKGAPSPSQEKAIFRRRPFGEASVRMLNKVGKHIDTAILEWLGIESILTQFSITRKQGKRPSRKRPLRMMLRLPAMSAMEPARSRVQPLASLLVIINDI